MGDVPGFAGERGGGGGVTNSVLQWLAVRTYNRFDPFWLGLCALAMRDHNWLAAFIFSVSGALISATIEWVAERSAAARSSP